MNPFEVAYVVMDAVEIHATRGCAPAIIRFQQVLESKDEAFEAAWIVAERLASHAEATGAGGVAFAVPMPAPALVIESAQLIARLVESASKQARDTARTAWDEAPLLTRVAAAIKTFHLTVELGAWTREPTS